MPQLRSGFSCGARVGSVLVACLFIALWAAGTARAEESISIGIMSGTTSPGVEKAFKRSVEEGLADFGPRLMAGSVAFTLRAIPASHPADREGCQAFARDLESQGVVAILGPITTDCTLAVLAAGVGVPVISPLATASRLTAGGSRDPWFFRATVDDRERMQRYVSFIDDAGSIQGTRTALLYQDTNSYAKGLKNHLHELLFTHATPTLDIAWSELRPLLRSLEKPSEFETLGEWFPGGLTRVFVLGNAHESIVLARALERLSGSLAARPSFEFLFVGSGSDLEGAPIGSFTIGEPALQNHDDFPPEVRYVLERFGSDEGSQHADFYLTAYEAARYVVPIAIRNALGPKGTLPELAELRDKVRNELETGSFDSLRPPTAITFHEGALVEPPTSPIYRVAARLDRVDAPAEEDWLELDVAREVRFLESPVIVNVKSRGLPDDLPITFSILKMGAKGRELMGTRKVTLEEGAARWSFHPKRPGVYRIGSDRKSYPNEPEVVVMWMGTAYLFAGLLALVGSVGAWLKGRGSLPLALTEGLVVGLLLAWLALYVREIPGTFPVPIPSFSDDVVVNAALNGLIGGWVGTALFGSFLSGRKRGREAKEKDAIPRVS